MDKCEKVAASAIIMDLSKAFDSLNHNLLIEKLKVHNFDELSLKFLPSYLTNRKQRTKINGTYSDRGDIYTMSDIDSNICNYAGGKTCGHARHAKHVRHVVP